MSLTNFAKNLINEINEDSDPIIKIHDVNNLNCLEVSLFIEGIGDVEWYYNSENEFKDLFKKDIVDIKEEIKQNPLICPLCSREVNYFDYVCKCSAVRHDEMDILAEVLSKILVLPEDKMLNLINLHGKDISQFIDAVDIAKYDLDKNPNYFLKGLKVKLKDLKEINNSFIDEYLMAQLIINLNFPVELYLSNHKIEPDFKESELFEDKKQYVIKMDEMIISNRSTDSFTPEKLHIMVRYTESLFMEEFKQAFNIDEVTMLNDKFRMNLIDLEQDLLINAHKFEIFDIGFSKPDHYYYVFTDEDKKSLSELIQKIKYISLNFDSIIRNDIRKLIKAIKPEQLSFLDNLK